MGRIKLRVFDKRVLRKMLGPKRDKVAGEWNRQHNEELHKLYASPSIIRVIILIASGVKSIVI
jgi:hypothetical protein